MRALTKKQTEALCRLCREGMLFEVQDWIAAGKSVLTGGAPDRSPLAIAAGKGFHSLVKLLLAHRLVRPCARDMERKIRSRDAIRSYMQRTGEIKRNDIEMEKLSRYQKVVGYHVVRYGALEVQYYLTLTNEAKTTLYVICADRTMRIIQRNGVAPGTRPQTIEVFGNGSPDDDLYLVTFDSGAVGVFAIEFRPHKENEHEHVPGGLWRLPRPVGNGQWPAFAEASAGMAVGSSGASEQPAVGSWQLPVGGGQFAAGSSGGSEQSWVGRGQGAVSSGQCGNPVGSG